MSTADWLMGGTVAPLPDMPVMQMTLDLAPAPAPVDYSGYF